MDTTISLHGPASAKNYGRAAAPELKDTTACEEGQVDLFSTGAAGKQKEEKFLDDLKGMLNNGKGLTLGVLLDSAYSLSGGSVWLHEQSHAAAIKGLFNDPQISIQIDAIDNIKNFVRDPSVENFKHVVTMYDSNKDGAAGVTRFELGDSPKPAAQMLGTNGVMAVISAAGCVGEAIPTFLGFAAGYKLRKEVPVLGYTLMAATSMHHINSSLYPFSALIPSMASKPGHDWGTFARATGIPPLLTATAFAATLPALGWVMHRMEKKAREREMSRQATHRLIANRTIAPQELVKAYEGYKGREKLVKAQDTLSVYMNTPATTLLNDDKAKKELNGALKTLSGEYAKFTDYLAETFRERVSEEVKNGPRPEQRSIKETIQDIKTSYQKAWNDDKVGTALATGSMGGAVAVGAGAAAATTATLVSAAGLQGASAVAQAIAPVIAKAVPVVGSLSAAHSLWQAGKTISNPGAGTLNKVTSGLTAAFSTLGAAGLFIPGAGAPLVLASVAGVLATQAAKFLIEKFA